jgi:hypothetical protein
MRNQRENRMSRERELPARSGEPAVDHEAEAGMPLTFYERLETASLDEKLVLAREVASHPRFDEEDLFEVGSRLEEALDAAGRYAEFEGVLEAWKQLAPRAYEVEPAVRTWRAELALRLPGRDVAGALTALARDTGDADLLLRLSEWCLYRGRLEEAWAGLREGWSRVREDETVAEWTRVDYVSRAALACMDAALRSEPDLTPERLGETLSIFARAVPHWAEKALLLRTGRQPWKHPPEPLLQIPPGDMFDEQRALVMALEPELRLRQGWPWGRTQLIYPELYHLMPGPLGHGGRVLTPRDMLLPDPKDVEHWVVSFPEDRGLHPHVHAATALALRPWGEFLHRLGLVDDAELAEWWERVWQHLTPLPEQLTVAHDPLLVEEAHRYLSGGWPHG